MGAQQSQQVQPSGFGKQGKRNKVLKLEYGKTEERTKALARQNMDEEQFASGLPKQNPALSDKLDTHRAGQLFKYAVITNAPSNERSSMLKKMRSYKPQASVEALTLDQIPPIRLMGDCITLNLSQVLDQNVVNSPEQYMSIDCVLIHFIPLDSFANDKSVVTIQLNDLRKVTNTVTREALVDNTMGYNILFFLDYCVEKRDMSKFTLSFSCSSKEFQPDSAWGAVKVIAQLQLRSFPIRLPLMGTMGVMLLSDTDLETYECDPRALDLVITAEALRRLQEAFNRGEIENRTIPQSDKKELTTAKTIIGPGGNEDIVDSVFERMHEAKQLQERQAAAQEANRKRLEVLNLEKPLKPILHRRVDTETTQVDVQEVPDDRDWERNLKDIEVEDSMSQAGVIPDDKASRCATVEDDPDEKLNSLNEARQRVNFNLTD